MTYYHYRLKLPQLLPPARRCHRPRPTRFSTSAAGELVGAAATLDRVGAFVAPEDVGGTAAGSGSSRAALDKSKQGRVANPPLPG